MTTTRNRNRARDLKPCPMCNGSGSDLGGGGNTTMTDTEIEIPDYITQAKTLTDITLIGADLLEHADDSNLPAPSHAMFYQGSQEVSLGFPGCVQSFHTLADWAERFGGTLTSKPHTHEDGRESVYCQVRFPYLGVSVDGYAFIPAGDLEASTT